MIINIIDEGCGISPEDSSRIFEKYYKAVTNLQRDSYGMGLGLYIARQIVEAHGGTITVDSKLGTGSTFTILLPLRKNQ